MLTALKFCIDYYEKIKKNNHLQYHKKNIKLFYNLMHKVSKMKYILFGCHICNKTFSSKYYLDNHIHRRHPNPLLDNLSSSINSHLSSIKLKKSTSSINLYREINTLLLEQQKIKKDLEEYFKELSLENQTLNLSVNLSPHYNIPYKSIEEAQFKNFLKEISSKPSSPPLEEANRNPLDLLLAAHALDLDPVTDTHYLYIAKQFLSKPLPKH